MSASPHYQTAIIGAGFCGTMTAVQLMQQAPDMRVALIEQNARAGQGLAYGTVDPGHLLNVRAGQMGAFAEDAGHFWRWLETQPDKHAVASAQDFAPRQIFGKYLADILQQCRKTHPNLEILNRRIVKIGRNADDGFEITSSDNQTITVNRVVLALGNFPPDQFSRDAGVMNPYLPATWQRVAEDGDVLIVGTGLTSLDLVVTLAKTKSSGIVHLLSRHGLLPREHAASAPHILKLKAPYPTTALGLCKAVRKEIADARPTSWQNVIDALRPLNQILWQGLNLVEQRRFMRHLRAYWDVHRHRCAPQVMDAYRKLESAGRLQLHHGSILKQSAQDQGWNVTWRPRGKSQTETLTVRHIVRCTGPQADFTKLDDALVQNMLQQGLIAADALRLGLSTQNYVVCDATGQPVAGLYALGGLLKGKLYESIAVPELRDQAAAIAKFIAQNS